MARILLVQNEARLARLIARVLGEERYTTETVGDSRSALKRVLAESFDLLIVDWMLPDLDGLQIVAGLAEELAVDLVVLGSRGAGAVERLVTASAPEGVVPLASCPVLVMRGGDEAGRPPTS